MKHYKFESWNVAFRKHEEDIENNGAPFTIIKNPLFFWAADPFVLYHNGSYYIFAELYNRLTYKGDIQYCKLSSDGRVEHGWRKALHTPGHLSFPYVYKQDGEYYMMPESSKSDNLVLYKAVRFPNKWDRVETLANNVKYADSIFIDSDTILTYDNHSRPRKAIWLKKRNDVWEEDGYLSDPEIIYRPAGKKISSNGKYIIPLQDSHNGEYGGSIHFVNQDHLDTSIFRIDPDSLKFVQSLKSKCVGVHTYNFDKNIEVIDIKTYTGNIFSFIGYAIRKFTKKCK